MNESIQALRSGEGGILRLWSLGLPMCCIATQRCPKTESTTEDSQAADSLTHLHLSSTITMTQTQLSHLHIPLLHFRAPLLQKLLNM